MSNRFDIVGQDVFVNVGDTFLEIFLKTFMLVIIDKALSYKYLGVTCGGNFNHREHISQVATNVKVTQYAA